MGGDEIFMGIELNIKIKPIISMAGPHLSANFLNESGAMIFSLRAALS